eukprot:253419-Chlamydomonas_euryale.AAC.2
MLPSSLLPPLLLSTPGRRGGSWPHRRARSRACVAGLQLTYTTRAAPHPDRKSTRLADSPARAGSTTTTLGKTSDTGGTSAAPPLPPPAPRRMAAARPWTACRAQRAASVPASPATKRALRTLLRAALRAASAIAAALASTPSTEPNRCARHNPMVPVPQYMSSSCVPPVLQHIPGNCTPPPRALPLASPPPLPPPLL